MVNEELNCCKTDVFSYDYYQINSYFWEKAKIQKSRYGDTKEMLDFKLQLTKPGKRCTGGFGRDINIFFLLAEALWIWAGRDDVRFLSCFNSRISEFSDDGVVFHAPYGHRLRHYDYEHSATPIDQINEAVKMFAQDKDDRRVVLSIWNPKLDLSVKSKDIPCNDLVMLKIRDGELHTTIQNRSNDLHWGLPTNVFQFSFLSEMICLCLGIEQGGQVHNSQSLHFYLNNPIAGQLYKNFNEMNSSFLYDFCDYEPIQVNFAYKEPIFRLDELDIMLSGMVKELTNAIYGFGLKQEFLKELKAFSPYFYVVFVLLYEYILYKQRTSSIDSRRESIRRLDEFFVGKFACMKNMDIVVLAYNFFFKRIGEVREDFIGTF